MIYEDEASILFILRKLVNMIEIYGDGFVPPINHHVISLFLLIIKIIHPLHELECARMMSDSAKSDGCVLRGHSSCRITLHNLVLHQCQLLSHLHGLLLMVQHIITHLVDDKFAAFDIFFGPLDLLFQPLNFCLLIVLYAFKYVLLLHERVTSSAHFCKLFSSLRSLLIISLYNLSLFSQGRLHLVLYFFLSLAGSSFEFI